jgi:hypothetical protein
VQVPRKFLGALSAHSRKSIIPDAGCWLKGTCVDGIYIHRPPPADVICCARVSHKEREKSIVVERREFVCVLSGALREANFSHTLSLIGPIGGP